MGFAKVGDARKKGTERERRERERETSPPALSRSLSTFSTLDAPGKKKHPSLLRRQVLPRGGRTYTLCGTPDYIAPEVLLNRGHGRGADWWSFGVLVYEALAGFPPFCAPDPADTYRRIVAGEWACPAHFSAAARDLVRRLLTADLSSRIGCLAGGAGDVKRHAWFRGVDWALLGRGEDAGRGGGEGRQGRGSGAGRAGLRGGVAGASDRASRRKRGRGRHEQL